MNVRLLKDPVTLNPRIDQWLEPRGDHLVVHSGRVELGQGIQAAIAQVAANELGLPAGQVVVPHPSTRSAPIEGLTAGSMSISSGAMSVRRAAAALRSLVIRQAARATGCPPDDLRIAEGKILRSGADTGQTVLGLCARLDLSVGIDTVPALDIGRTRTRTAGRPDLRDKIAGTPFLHDMTLPGLLHGRVIHPPTVPARLDHVDIAALQARPGVHTVVRDGDFLGLVAEIEWDAARAADWAGTHVSWHSDAQAPADIREALRRSNAPVEIAHAEGEDPGDDLRRVATTVSRPFTAHASIGPSAAIALWEGEALTVWTHSQGIGPLRSALAAALRIDDARITVQHAPGAGCYGHNGADDAAYEAALLARAVPGRPVRLQWSRADELGFSASGAAMLVEAEARLTPDNRLASITVRPTSTPHINRPCFGGQPNLRSASLIADPHPVPEAGDLPMESGAGVARNAVPLYAAAHIAVEKRLVGHLPYRTSSQRALGAIGNVLAIEAMMDDAAAATGQDPVALRLAHLDDPRARAVIETAVDLADPPGPGGAGIGRGLGFARYKNTAGYCAVIAAVEVDEDVRVTEIWSAADLGEVICPDGAANQIEGGILQALSWTLKEALPIDAGRITAETWDDYPILTFSEVPPVTLRILDRPGDPPLGAGEAATGPTAAALSNAVRHALGMRIGDLPLTRDTIARALLAG